MIFDLDETILPSANVPDEIFSELLYVIRKANQGTVPEDDLEKALSQIKQVAIDALAEEFGFNEQMKAVAKEVLTTSNYKLNLEPFEDYEVLKSLSGIKVLVTSGVVNLQQEKINALGLTNDFDEVIIDDVYDENRLGKKEIFEQLRSKYNVEPDKMWIIGDNPEAEIMAGNELGMITVQRTSPYFKPDKKATHVIDSFSDLKKILKSK